MVVHFEGTEGKRKELVQALVDVTGVKAEYLGAPGFEYRVGEIIVHRDGGMEVNDLMDTKEIGLLLHALRAKGFICMDDGWIRTEDAPSEDETSAAAADTGIDGITLSFPKDMNAGAIANLRKLVEGKGWLLKQALGVEALPVVESEDKLTFPWLPGNASREMVNATICLIAALIKLAKKLKRVMLTPAETDNPRYAFRCFLLRLGFIGDEYSEVRKLLMRGIPGNGSRRHIETPEQVE